MNAVELINVTKSFEGINVLNNLNLSIPEGCIFGLVGENGAGKTTTMKLLLGLLPLDSGCIKLFNHPVSFGKQTLNKPIGYLPDVPQFYDYMSAFDYLDFCCMLTHMDTSIMKEKIVTTLENVGLKNTSQRIGDFSRGMRQRLGLAQSLMNDPQLIICDEPTSALDPTGRHEFLSLIHSLKGKTTILFSSHILTDVEEICDEIAILHRGKTILYKDIPGISQTKTSHYLIQFNHPNSLKQFSIHLTQEKIPYQLKDNFSLICSLLNAGDEQILLTILSAEQIFPVKLQLVELSLEDIFLKVMQYET